VTTPTDKGLNLTPVTVRGTRIYAADGEEIAVATRASNKWRGSADDTALRIKVALNSHEAARWTLKIAMEECDHRDALSFARIQGHARHALALLDGQEVQP